MVVNDVLADAVDFHFEDWKKGANPKKGTKLIPAIPSASFINDSFSAPLWDGGYLNVNKERIPDVGLTRNQWAATRKFQTLPKVDLSAQARYQRLPAFWFDFASLYLNGKKVKEQEWPRDYKEATEKAGTVTAFNPQGRKASAEKNRSANRKLRTDLQQAKIPFNTIDGRYKGRAEKSFSVPKIEKGKISSLGRRYGQEKVMWGGNEMVP